MGSLHEAIERGKKLGVERGTGVAERIGLEPAWDLMDEILRKWRQRAPWKESAERELEHLRPMGSKLEVAAFKKAFTKSFIETGVQWIKAYIRENKQEGLLQDL